MLLSTLIAASAALTTATDYESAEAPYFAARRAFYDAEDSPSGVTDTERAAWACVMDNMATVLDALREPVTPLVVMVGAR